MASGGLHPWERRASHTFQSAAGFSLRCIITPQATIPSQGHLASLCILFSQDALEIYLLPLFLPSLPVLSLFPFCKGQNKNVFTFMLHVSTHTRAMWECMRSCHVTHVDVGTTCWSEFSPPPRGFWGLNSDCQVCWQVPLSHLTGL